MQMVFFLYAPLQLSTWNYLLESSKKSFPSNISLYSLILSQWSYTWIDTLFRRKGFLRKLAHKNTIQYPFFRI